MKKLFFLMICSTLLLSACGNNETVSQQSLSESVVESSVESLEEASKTLGNMDSVNEKIKEFTERADYKNADTDKKFEMALNFLEELKHEGLIKYYDKNYIDGSKDIEYGFADGVGIFSVRDENDDTDGDSAEDDELWKKMNQAEEKIKTFLESEDYKNSDKNKKVEMAMKFLEQLKNDGFIAHYDYFEDNELISYSHLNGVLGGISFHDFSEKIDGLAMN